MLNRAPHDSGSVKGEEGRLRPLDPGIIRECRLIPFKNALPLESICGQKYRDITLGT